jgi:hypothetical protein
MIQRAADAIFTVALDGHDPTVTHSDGSPWFTSPRPALRMGMGEV